MEIKVTTDSGVAMHDVVTNFTANPHGDLLVQAMRDNKDRVVAIYAQGTWTYAGEVKVEEE